jgi:hypothetical protein
MDGVSKTPNGLQWQGKSKTWDEGNVLSDKGKLTTVMLWAKKNIDDLYHKMGSEFQVYSDGNDEGDSGRGQSDGNQIIQNIVNKIGKIGNVKENFVDDMPHGLLDGMTFTDGSPDYDHRGNPMNYGEVDWPEINDRHKDENGNVKPEATIKPEDFEVSDLLPF